jgi:MFS transporter, Spinster family, sphingosine-1-phosphate transporter
MLGLLLVILACNFLDRTALGLLLQDIQAEFHLGDTQLGLLTGIAFAFFYSLMGVPIARWSDRGNRVAIIAITTGLWSVAVALSGLVTSFLQLLVVRAAVAVGEAGCIPPALSLIADRVPRRERPRAVSIYMLGAPVSVVIGYFLAGWLNELYGWRATFMILGAPGLVLALLAWRTLSEPRQAESRTRGAEEHVPLERVAAVLWRSATFRHLLLCFSVVYFFGYGILQWQPMFFMRSFGLGTGELGTWLAAIYGVGGAVGTYWGGAWASRHAARNERLQLRAMAVLYCAFALLSAAIYLSRNPYVAFALLGVAAIGGAMTTGPLFATIQTLVPQNMRAVAIALVYLIANLIGLGLGPLAAGAISDALHSRFGSESLRYALLALSPGYIWGAWHLLRASASVDRDLATLDPASPT